MKSNKTSYQKLYLIQPQIYHQIMSKLSDVEKNDLVELNEQYNNTDSKVDDNVDDSHQNDVSELNDNFLDTQQKITPKMSDDVTSSVKNTMIKAQKPKRFQCDSCIKRFTTKFSLKRHIKRFHDPSQVENSDEKPSIEIEQPTQSNSLTGKETLKRKYPDDDDDESNEYEPTTFKRAKVHSLKRKLPVDNTPIKRHRWMQF